MFQLWVVGVRTFLIGGGGLFAVLGSNLVGYSGAGPLGCIIAAFVACSGWKLQGWSNSFVSLMNMIFCFSEVLISH
jgi:hypothetical protein